ncbi:transcription initiation factor TFIID subunit 2-like isoform X1 [Chenopodium quinoa]|uniref:transcription initiation factor TFIID subunit 2-like isoform X1 n=2 Tax=Chenopodium quinoa TaxID=63459 RepID=UPI000B771760|nr:transcription initiation factor TFIID subunit 2-like isoform X1 [Chenopodium quinoa]
MAKPRKPPKNEASKSDSSSAEALVLHQKLCLSIDVNNNRIHGYTELEIAVPDSGIIGLHAENLEIERVSVDGEPAEFDVFPHYQPVEIENRWCSVSSVSSAADAAGVTYISALERELVPNLLILCRKSIDSRNQQEGQLTLDGLENGGQSNGEVKQNVKLIRIDYWVEKAEAGMHFNDSVLHTNSQIRRAHCWFPCMDDNLQCCCYDLEFTVPHNFVAVSNGKLLYQVLSKDDPPRKTFVYKLDVPVSAQWISLAIAPFQILPDYHNSLLSHMCLPGNVLKLQNTVGYFHSAFRHYEIYLKCPFPFGSYKQVFIAPEMVISSVTLGASMSIFSSQILFDEKVIDQTIDTRIKLAHALARQWFGVYITPETPNDEWLVEGLAGFLTDTYIKEFLGNNEARYRRYKANCAVCKADDSGATTLSPSSSPKDLYGTQSVGLYGRIRSWKSVAILQMLEKQMGPDLFKGIFRTIVSRAQDATRSLRTLSTKEFRHFANKVGNLERPFLKEFFHRWVETCGCPILRMGFSYNKRKNLVELAAFRECTATANAIIPNTNSNMDSENREGDNGWPGMMTIKVHELDGTHDHLLPMAGDAWQLLEIKCHSRLAAKRLQKPKKGSKPDGSDDNGDTVTAVDIRSGTDSPLLWVRADPEMEYLAEIHFNQPLQLWINQLEKDRDVVAQAQAIATLEELSNIPFPVVNALNNFIADSKVFWRVRIEAAFALAKVASEETGWSGMLNLVKFYKAKRFDPSIGLPKPNDFHDFSEYFVLEAIPHAVATVRTADKKSPREAVEFVLQVLKYNDNSGNPYSDVFWLAALVEAIGELEFGQQNIAFLSSLLKRIDRLLQYDRLMPSYNGILTISCIRAITQMALKLSEFIPLDSILELIKPFQDCKAIWQVRIEARRALLDIEFYSKGIDAALLLFIKFLEEESSLRGQAKLGIHVIRLSQISAGSGSSDDVRSQTLVALLRLLESRVAFRNVFLRHHLFCILQVLSGRRPTLYVIPRDHMRQTGYAEICSEQRNTFLAFINQMKPAEHPIEIQNPFQDGNIAEEMCKDVDAISNSQEHKMPVPDAIDVDTISNTQVHVVPASNAFEDAQEAIQDAVADSNVQVHIIPAQEAVQDAVADSNVQVHIIPAQEAVQNAVTDSNVQVHIIPAQEAVQDAVTDSNVQVLLIPAQEAVQDAVTDSNVQVHLIPAQEAPKDVETLSNSQMHIVPAQEVSREADAVSISQDRKTAVFKIRVKQTANSNKSEKVDNLTHARSQAGHNEIHPVASSSVSVDAPQQNLTEAVSISNQITEEVNSCQGRGSHMTASIGSAKLATEGDEVGKELLCTADSSTIPTLQQLDDCLSPNFTKDNLPKAEVHKQEVQLSLSVAAEEVDVSQSTLNPESHGKKKSKKKDKEKKRKRGDDHKSHRDDPEYLERKRLKKEKKKKKKKKKEKEMAKLLNDERNVVSGDGHSRLENEKRLFSNNDTKAVSTESLAKNEAPAMNTESIEHRPFGQEIPLEPTLSRSRDEFEHQDSVRLKPNESNGPKLVLKTSDRKSGAPGGGGSGHKLRIKIKTRK